jgi:hypothetical protein
MNIDELKSSKAIFSPCRRYRYALWREWWETDCLVCDATMPPGETCNTCQRTRPVSDYLMVIGLNPSTADETKNDPTIRRCIGFAKQWGFSALCMTNLFAFRATQPKDMKAENDPVGPENDHWLHEARFYAGRCLAAWGTHGSHMGRDAQVKFAVQGLSCLGKNANGSPKHPLYIAANTQPITFP